MDQLADMSLRGMAWKEATPWPHTRAWKDDRSLSTQEIQRAVLAGRRRLHFLRGGAQKPDVPVARAAGI